MTEISIGLIYNDMQLKIPENNFHYLSFCYNTLGVADQSANFSQLMHAKFERIFK